MVLQPNIGSDRSWVWKTAADMSEGAPAAETLAVRFANSDSTFPILSSLSSPSTVMLTFDVFSRRPSIQGGI